MAVTPSMAQLAGAHLSTYEALFKQVDTNGTGVISALDAASFLKKSGLSVGVLSQVWELADSAGRGFLDKHALFLGLKLIALAQNSHDMSLANLILQVPPPSMGTPASPALTALGPESDGWAIQVTERAKYNHIFEGLQPINGMLTGDKVRPVLLNSGLPVDVLGLVWELSDIDEDGFLDCEEFAVAMHLVYRALEKQPVPKKLPPSVIPPSKRKKSIAIPGAIRVLPPVGLLPSPPHSSLGSVGSPPPVAIGRRSPTLVAPMAGPSGGALVGWVVTAIEKIQFEEMFLKIDSDMDGLVNGVELREIFLQSGLNQQVLAHIWNLCDTRGVGQLNLEQFCLAMHLMQQKLTGVDPPQTLPANMVPPSMRGLDGAAACTDTKELEMISKEIDDLKMKKLGLEQEKAQKEADIKISNSEVLALQKEFDAISTTVNQLETQKCEAQKRLDELDDKRNKLESLLLELKDKCDEEENMITKLKSRIENQETDEQTQEVELRRMRDELNDLRQQEAALEEKTNSRQQQLNQLSKNLETVMQEVTQTKANIRSMEGNENGVGKLPSPLVNGNAAGDSRTLTPCDSDMFSIKATAGSSPVSSTSGFSSVSGLDDDPFKSRDPFANTNGDSMTAPADPFAGEDPFKNVGPEDPFKGNDPFHGGDSFAAEFDPFGADPFKDSLSAKAPASDLKASVLSSSATSSPMTTLSASSKPFTGDPFGKDPFNSSFSSMKSTTATNDPFSSSASTVETKSTAFPPSDPFGTDPFAPTKQKKSPAPPRPAGKSGAIGRSRSPVPSLPPKHKKAPPPPRPPAPKPSPGSSGKAVTDPFGGSDPFGSNNPDGGGGSAFGGDFADFSSNKLGGSTAVESDDLAWATIRSKEEFMRQKQLEEQEKADLELAIALSKADMT